MKTLEEQLWAYIDGTSDAEETAETKALLLSDPKAAGLYQELLILNSHFGSIDLDEPSMSFTRNVMEQVALEIPPVALKTKIDKRIILGIGFFFVASILAVFVYAVAGSISSSDVSFSSFTTNFNIEKYLSSTGLKIFLFVDAMLGLICLDMVLRRKLHIQKKEA